ncbi:MAG: uridine monophosphate kinase [bacterium]|nr:uridine monophosphate kinase [bacterium]
MRKERALLKISGETLGTLGNGNFDPVSLHNQAQEIVSVEDRFELAIVVGGGNLIRGKDLMPKLNLKDQSEIDFAGMLATVINAKVLGVLLKKHYGLDVRVMSAIDMNRVAEPYIIGRAVRHLEKGRVIILAGGTGNPFTSTDSAMTLRGHELEAKHILKGTKVDGVFDKDPVTHADAKLLPHVSYQHFIEMNLGIIDAEAIAFARKCKLPIRVFNIFKKGNLRRVLVDGDIGSEIS